MKFVIQSEAEGCQKLSGTDGRFFTLFRMTIIMKLSFKSKSASVFIAAQQIFAPLQNALLGRKAVAFFELV